MTMEPSTLLIIGLFSGIIGALAYLPYILDTINNRVQPQRASWLIWLVMCSLAFYSQFYEGASVSLWFAGFQVAGCVAIFLLSIRHGAGEFLCKKNMVIFFAAGMGLLALYLTKTAAYTLMITIFISFLGGVVTIQKAYHDPESESFGFWTNLNLASGLAVLSIDKVDWLLLAYPVFLVMLYTTIMMAIVLGRFKKYDVFMRPVFEPIRINSK